MSAIDERHGVIRSAELRPFGEVRSGYTYFEEGDVLFAKITPCMQNGKQAIAYDMIDGFGFGTTEFHVLRPGKDVLAGWVHQFLRQPTVLTAAMKHFSGAVGQQRVPDGFLKSLLIPLPPLPDQRAILAALTDQIAAVDRARAAAEVQVAAAEALPAAYLRELFDGEIAKSWPTRRIGEVAKVQSGYAFKSDWFTTDGVRLLRNINVSQGYLDWTQTVRLPTSQRGKYPSYDLAAGDIVLSLDRPVVKSGLKVAMLTSNDVPSLLLQRVGRLRLTDHVHPSYLYAFLNSTRFIAAITRHDQSVGVPHVSPGQVESVEIPIPPPTVQLCISEVLDTQSMLARRMGHVAAEQRTVLDRLPATLLRHAFDGRL
jgi:type I restriction enzyme, S subunit